MDQPLPNKPRRGRPARTFERLGDTRDALIRAGMEMFTAQGFSSTGIEVVLKRMGIPKGSFYHYFGSKEAFGREVLTAYDAYIRRKLERWLSAPDRGAIDKVLDFVADARAGIERHDFMRGCLVGNLGQEVSTLPEGFREELDRVMRGWQAIVSACLKHGQQTGEIPAAFDCDKLGALFWIGWEGAVLRSRLERSGEPLETFSQAFAQLVRRLLKPGEIVFKAIVIEKDAEGYRAAVQQLPESTLPEGDVTLDVHYSTLNFKDGLAITGKAPVVRKFPMVPGIDLVGTVRESTNADFKSGDKVVLNGWGVGEGHWGGLAQKARLKGEWLIPLPAGISPRQAMAIGTAGYTAMLCVMALERHSVKPGDGDVLVTGASGGVGSFAIALLAKLGYRVVASTGRPAEAEYLKELGAAEIVDRATLSEPGKPLQKERWAAAVDSIGSHTLANICASMKADGVVAACGNAQGLDFPASVAPFILRGVSLIGINSVTRPRDERVLAWQRLSELLDLGQLNLITEEISLGQAVAAAGRLMQGSVRGRLVVDVNR
jgi:acrylyl-CoA reductase (NADPH)